MKNGDNGIFYINKECIKNEELRYLDWDIFQETFSPLPETYEDLIEILKGEIPLTNNRPVINITKLINLLKEKVDSNATHIAIDFDWDLCSMQISSFNVKKSTSKDITEYKKDEIRKTERIKKLLEKRNRITEEINKLTNK